MNGSDRNEKWQLWQERIHEYRASGLTMRAWCAARQVSYDQLKYWLRKQADGKRASTATTWVAVNPTPPLAPETSPLVVRIGKVVIDIHPGFDAVLFGQVVRVLEARS